MNYTKKSIYKLPEKTKENSDPLVEKLTVIIDVNLNNEQFGVEKLAKEVGISRSHLHRKLHEITDKSVSQFIREYRLIKAKNLLIEKDISVSEAANEVGFGSASYFSKSFANFYGYPPSKNKKNQQFEILENPNVNEVKEYISKGWFYFEHFTSEFIEKAQKCFKKAVNIDPLNAGAFVGIAACYQVQASIWIGNSSPIEALILSKPFIDKALELDSNIKEAYGLLGFYYLYYEWNFNKAEIAYKKAAQSKVPLYKGLCISFLCIECRYVEAHNFALKFNKENPYFFNSPLIMTFSFTNNKNKGLNFVNDRLKVYKNILTIIGSSQFMLNTKQYKKVIDLLEPALLLEENHLTIAFGIIGSAYANLGKYVQAKKALQHLNEIQSKTIAGSPAFFCAMIYSALGDKERALDYLKTAINNHEMEVPWLVSEPQLYPLHEEPTFIALVKKVGFRPHAFPIKN